MTLDLDNIAPEARSELVEVGRKFSSTDTLAQADQTLTALSRHGTKLADYGFGPEDCTELKDAREELSQAGVGRDNTRKDKKINRRAYMAAVREGQTLRLQARSVVTGGRRVLVRTGNAAKVVQSIDTVLERDSVTTDDAEALGKQLKSLRDLLVESKLEAAVKTRGGPKVVAAIAAHLDVLHAATQEAAGVRGTPAETEHLDLIDGIIVGLARSARDAAEAASKALAEPAILDEFELSALYAKGRKKGNGPEEPGGGSGV